MRPVIIIGAPRSGTNILRDVLTGLPGLTTWPCDEINLMWRHGNARYPSDELPPELATPPVQRYMRRQFERLAGKHGCEVVVEKTCANSLRVDFVERIFPDATYLFIVRDGIDAIASAMQRWKAPFDLGYTLRKVRFVPAGDLPYYGARFLRNRLHRLVTSEKRLAVWGPVFDGMGEAAAELTLADVCTLQWKACVGRADSSLGRLPAERVVRLRYEEFAAHPAGTIEATCTALGLSIHAREIEAATRAVRNDSIGNGRRLLTNEQLRLIEARIGPT